MSVHKTPLATAQLLNRTTYLGFDTVRRWRWICHVCNLECNPPMATQPEAYTAALEHLEDEHLALGATR